MSSDTCFASITADHGIASELVHVSPIFARCGPSTRGRHAESREARTWRTDARRSRRQVANVVSILVESFDAFAEWEPRRGPCEFRGPRA